MTSRSADIGTTGLARLGTTTPSDSSPTLQSSQPRAAVRTTWSSRRVVAYLKCKYTQDKPTRTW